ncbi:MAG: serine dehydratase subunit alpha family protein [Anaerolineae bacterium]|nr:serine dehydratase subunit alpha family protein [Anaerolineae bacterium]
MDKETLLRELQREIERTTGCTDPVSISLAVSRAVHELGCPAEEVSVVVSANLYKNAINVGIPGTDKRGMLWAAALGAAIDNSAAGLSILDGVGDAALCAAEDMLRAGRVHVRYDDDAPDPLYVAATASAGGDRVTVVIMYDYANIVGVYRDGEPVLGPEAARAAEQHDALTGQSVRDLIALATTLSAVDVSFLREAAEVNKRAALRGLQDPQLRLGPVLWRSLSTGGQVVDMALKAQALTAAASEARMLGLKVPVIAVTGSGNQGITDLVGVLSVAEDVGAGCERTARALAISTLITVYVKGLTRRLTSFCGAAVAAATGVAAATAYLLGGDYDDMEHAMQSVAGTFAGMLCDGAKVSCAYKIGAAILVAVQYGALALRGAYVPRGDGIVGNTIEETFAYLGGLNNPGMTGTESFVLKAIQEIQGRRPHG